MSAPSLATYADFAAALVAARLERGWSQPDLAARMVPARSVSTVSSWESGRRTPSAAAAQQWAATLDVPWPADTTAWFSRATKVAVAQCGTRNGATRHRNRGEQVCNPCLDAASAFMRNWRARKAKERSS